MRLGRLKSRFPLKFTVEDELQFSIKNGLDEDFLKSINKVNVNCIDDVVNKVKVTYIIFFSIACIICFTFIQRYFIDGKQEVTLLIEAAIYGRSKIVKHLLDNLNVNVDAPGKIFHCTSKLFDGVTALWCAASKYICCVASYVLPIIIVI